MHFITYNKISNANSALICAYLTKAILVLSMPSALCLLFGEGIVRYLKGELGKESRGITAVIDASGVSSFFGRF
jgi:hypothetical protein